MQAGKADMSGRDEGWTLQSVLHYWDPETSAIERFSLRLGELRPEQRTAALVSLSEAVENHTAGLQDHDFAALAASALDDVYRSALLAPAWDDHRRDFLAATMGMLLKQSSRRGLVLHFIIDNSFDYYERPLSLFPRWFAAAGSGYVCPQAIAFRLSGGTSVEPADLAPLLPSFMQEAEVVARATLADLSSERRHFVFLSTDGTSEQMMRDYGLLDRSPGVVIVFRGEAPVKGSNIEIVFPK